MRILGQTLLVATTAAVVFVITPACVTNDQSIFIRGALAPSEVRINGACIYTGDPTQPALFQGEIDVAVRDNYLAVLLVGNQMIARGDNLAPRSESNKAHINGAVVRVTDANGGAISSFTSPSQGFVDQAEGTQATYGAFQVVALDAPTVAKISKGLQVGGSTLVIANIKAFGQSVGGVDLESGEYELPIKVCNGCLLTFTGFDDPLTPGIDCSLTNTSATTGGATQPPCNSGQDQEPAPCNTCLLHEVTCGGDIPGSNPVQSCAGMQWKPCAQGPVPL